MKRKTFVWIAVVLGFIALIAYGLRPRPVEVDYGVVERGTLTVTVDEDGETRIRDPYLISAPLAGRLMRVELEPGDPIARDQILAAIDPGEPGLLDARSEAEAQARVNAAEAAHGRAQTQIDIATAEVTKAQRYYERDLARWESDNIPKATVEDSEHALRVAKSNLSAAQSGLQIAKFEWDQARAALLHSRALADPANVKGRHFEIHSPIEGVVLRRFQESSTVIPAGERIVEIGDPHDLEVRIDVLSQDAVRIKPGQRVIVEHWGGEEELTAWVRRVEPSAFTKVSALGVDEQRVWVVADFSIKEGTIGDETGSDRNPPPVPSLGDAYRVEARIVVSETADAVKVPAGALFRSNGDWSVFGVTGEGKAVLKTIQLGRRNDLEAEVLEGLAEGEQVVLHPSDKVAAGVTLRERP